MISTLVVGVALLLAAWMFWHERHNSDNHTLSITYTALSAVLGAFVLVAGMTR